MGGIYKLVNCFFLLYHSTESSLYHTKKMSLCNSRFKHMPLVKGKVYIKAKWPIRLVLISGFSSMKWPGVFLLTPGCDASLLQDYSTSI